MLQRVFTLSDAGFDKSNTNPILQAPFDVILKTMKNWCGKYQEEGNIKGLVIFGYSLDDHLKFLKYPDNILKNYLNNKTSADFQETVTVYNPQRGVIFLLRRANDMKDLHNEMKSSCDDMLKFVFLYNDILKNSGIKLINLLVSDQDIDQLKCKFCKHQVISMNSLDSSDSFQKWLDKKECHFETDYNPTNDKINFSDKFSAKILGFLASFQFSKEYHFHCTLPSLTENPETQMDETTILLTLEQLKIVNSPNKHLMIQGCYGSGKSLIALKKAEMTSKTLKQNELLYFICYDSSSMLTADIVSIPNMKLYRNESALKLSDIIIDIKKNHPKRNINLFVDEYDAEHLDKPEAKKLNQMFTTDEQFRDSIICLAFEVLERERMVDGITKQTNLLDLLTSMELKELTYNKRNTLEIHKLVKLTTDVLRNLTITVYVPDDTGKSLKIQSGLEKSLKEERNSVATNRDSSTEQQKRERDKDNDVKKNINDGENLIFDEVSKYLPGRTDLSDKEVTTTFRHRDSKYSGHPIVSEKPNHYEINYSQESAKFITLLIAVLEQVIGNDYGNISKHVILHFDVKNDIPRIFKIAFTIMGILDKVTNRYEEFKKIVSKKIFITNFRAFRGLEYPRMVVVLDQNLRGLEHYLPECLSRCTTYLHTLLLNENDKMLENPHLKDIITSWNIPQPSDFLIKSWTMCIPASDASKDSNRFYEKLHRDGIIRVHSTSRKYKELEEKLQEFLKTENPSKENVNQQEISSAITR